MNNKIKSLKLSHNISEIAQERVELDQIIKTKNEKLKMNCIRIAKYEQIIQDSKNKNLSLLDVKKIYSNAKIEIPELLNKTLSEVEIFYKNLLEDKLQIYNKQILQLKHTNKNIIMELELEQKKLDELSKIISENNSVLEALKIYNLKANEKICIETKISEINGKLTQINNSKELKTEIDNYIVKLDETFACDQGKIEEYKEFVYNLVRKVYGDERDPYLSINTTETKQKYKAMPVTIDLTFDGDSGEGLTSAKYLLFDYLIMNYTNYVDFLIEDSSCFEAIDRRQIKNIIQEGINISKARNKQLIISLNKYLLDEDDLNKIKDFIVLPLNENDTLLNLKF